MISLLKSVFKQPKHLSGYSFYTDTHNLNSGGRFFKELTQTICQIGNPIDVESAKVVLFNISASWREIIGARIRGKIVILRVDGLYFDQLSKKFINEFPAILRFILCLGLRYKKLESPMSHIGNFIYHNYKNFFKIALSNHVVYQSYFSLNLHQRYFPNKKCTVILNGCNYCGVERKLKENKNEIINIVTIYDEWRPSKRMEDVVRFIIWFNNSRRPANLILLGYTGNIPSTSNDALKNQIENSSFIKILPRYEEIDGLHKDALLASDCFLTFSFRDACPNVVIEGMAHGLPVIGLKSGGIPEIVGDAGCLIPFNDFESGFFSAHRFEACFPRINFDLVGDAVEDVVKNMVYYRLKVRQRFDKEISMVKTGQEYLKVLNLYVGQCDKV